MTEQIAASQTAVEDFAPTCDCGSEAEAYLEVHAFHHCTPERPTWTSLLCRPCLRRDIGRVQEILLDGGVTCKVCGLTMVAMSDMVVRLSPLWAIGDEDDSEE